MRLLEWTERYNVDILEVDADHRRLFELCNAFTRAVHDGEPPARRLGLFEDYLRHLRRHAAAEEGLMAACQHADAATHRAEHGVEAQALAGVLEQARAERLALGPSVAGWLRDRLERHVLVEDRPLYLSLHPDEAARGRQAFRDALTGRHGESAAG